MAPILTPVRFANAIKKAVPQTAIRGTAWETVEVFQKTYNLSYQNPVEVSSPIPHKFLYSEVIMHSSITKIPTAGMNHNDWLAERRKSLGGSDMGAVLGLNRFRSPYSVWADKTGKLPDTADSEAMRIGRDLEP